MSEPLLRVEALQKSFATGEGTIEVLRGAELRLEPGERVAIVGQSGVGKSTLLHILGTLERPTRGSVRFQGEDVFAKPPDELAAFRNTRLGFVFQFHHLLPEFTAVENVAMPLRIARASKEDAGARARTVLKALGLDHRFDHRPAQLSGGEQQRVAVARALVANPRLVLADEPTGNLDTSTSRELVALLRSVHERRGLTSIIVTHSEAVASVCDRVLRMEDGLVKVADPP